MADQTKTVILRSEAFVTDYILHFREEHVVGQPARMHVAAVLEEEIPLSELSGGRAQLQLKSESASPRTFWGIVESVELHATSLRRGETAGRPNYSFTIVSALGLLEHSVDCRIFQDLSVNEIIAQVLELHGIGADQVEWKLNAAYPKREYTTQYQESALNFISRLAESEGIYFYSTLDTESEFEKFVFADTSADASPELSLPLRHPSRLMAEGSAVYSVNERHAVASGKVTLNAFDFKRPSLDLLKFAEADTLADLELYDFSDDYTEPDQGQRLSQVRLEAEQAKRCRLTILTDEPSLHVGHKLTIETPDSTDAYFVIGVVHRYDRQGNIDGIAENNSRGGLRTHRSYQVEAQLVPLDVPYRLEATHPAPVIYGPQTATVVAPDGAQMEEIFCDEHGRCKVKFHWDRSDEFFDHASCWMRVTQLQTSGSMILPRVHWEVLVEFLDGNPDHPYITGRLFNGTFMPPYQLPEGKTRTSIQTASTPGGGGKNEIRFEDKAGAEEIMVHSQYNTVIAAANNRKKTIGKNETLVVGNNASIEVGANSDTKVTYGFSQTVGANQDITVGANRSVEVNAVYGLTTGGDASTTVGANQFEMVGNPLDGIISLAAAKAAEVAQAAAAQVMGQVQGQIQGAIGAAMGPINGLLSQANALAGPMSALSDGGLGAAPGLISAAGALPSASGLAASMLPASARQASGADASSGGINLANTMNAAVGRVAGAGLAAARSALGTAAATDASGAGGASMANRGGPDGAVSGLAEEDLAAGPGHSQYKITGNHSETIGALGLTAAASSVLTNVTGDMTQSVGAAHIELILGDRAESIEQTKSETSAGLIVISKSDESETVSAVRSALIGGAKIESVKGNRLIESEAMVSLVGAMHKVEAKTKLTFKCGASSVVVDGGGVTITSPAVNISAASITLTKNVDNG